MYKPSWLSAELQGILDNNNPLNGLKLGIVLAKFSLTIIPPTLGAATGIIPAMNAYNSAHVYGKVKGIEDAVNVFAKQNANGMSIISAGLFTGTAPPPLKGTQPLYDIVRIKKQDKKFLCDALSKAIYINWTLGKSIFTPSGTMIPTWNIPFLSKKITDEVDILPLQASAKSATQKAIIQATREITSYDVEEYRTRLDRFD
jgi:ammonia channel protein AmtB